MIQGCYIKVIAGSDQETHDLVNQQGNVSSECLGNSYFWDGTLQNGVEVLLFQQNPDVFRLRIVADFMQIYRDRSNIYIYRLYRFAMTRMLRHPKQDLVDELHKSHDSPKRIFPILLGSKRYLYFFIAVFESSNETFFFQRPKARYLWWFRWNFSNCWNFFCGFQVHRLRDGKNQRFQMRGAFQPTALCKNTIGIPMVKTHRFKKRNSLMTTFQKSQNCV